MGNATSTDDERFLASQISSSSKEDYDTQRIRQYLLMLDKEHSREQNCIRNLQRTGSTCSSESLGEAPRKRRLLYSGLTNRMVSRLKNRSQKMTSLDAFICYARSDGTNLAKSLSEKMKDFDMRIKLDTKSKSSSCNDAINHARYAIVILSPGFFDDEHAISVLERLIDRQLNGERFILPIWHEVDETQVFENWPQMCDIWGLKTSIGVQAIVRKFRSILIHGIASTACRRVCQV